MQARAFNGLKPTRNRRWLESDNHLTILLVPKFGDNKVGRWLNARLQKPHYRINLDEIGTFVWQRCDGTRTVEQIVAELSAHFGDRIEPAHDRLCLFLNSLAKSRSITWN